MDKVVLSTQDIEWLLEWRDAHKDAVRMMPSPLKAVEIICKDTGWHIKGFRGDNELKLHINHGGQPLGASKFKIGASGSLLTIPSKDRMQLEASDKQSVLTVYCSLMALMTFGNMGAVREPPVTKQREIHPHKVQKGIAKRTKKPATTYILRKTTNGLQAISQGSHASPGFAFNVRGHYRHYKSGKVVWVSEFTKGNGKTKDKTYKMGANVK